MFPHSPSTSLTLKNIHSALVNVISQHTQDRIVELFQANEKHLNFLVAKLPLEFSRQGILLILFE